MAGRRAASAAPTRPPSSPRTRGGAAARRGPDAGDHTHAAATGPDPGVGVLATPTDGQRHRPPLRVAPLDGAPEPPGWPASPTGRQRGHGGVVVGAHDGRVGSPSGHAPLPCLRGHLPDVHRIARPPDPGAPRLVTRAGHESQGAGPPAARLTLTSTVPDAGRSLWALTRARDRGASRHMRSSRPAPGEILWSYGHEMRLVRSLLAWGTSVVPAPCASRRRRECETWCRGMSPPLGTENRWCIRDGR